MKKIRIWVNSFNLMQQFLLVAFLTISASIYFYIGFFNSSVDQFVDTQMYSYLHRYQSAMAAYGNSALVLDGNVDSFIYNLEERRYITAIPEEYAKAIELVDPYCGNAVVDGSFHLNNQKYVYSIMPYGNAFSIVTFVNGDYYLSYQDALQNGVFNTALAIIFALFSFFMVWVFSIMTPLNKIKIFIDRLKNDERAKLDIRRHDEIGEVAEALVGMNQELDKQKRIREEMIQNISHDLKTPIATIKSYSESIKDGVYPYDSLEKSVDVIIEHADRLEKKVYSLITYNKLGYLTDTSEGENLKMEDVINKAILSVKVLRNDIRIETNFDEEVYFHGEEEPWRVVIENLLDNGLRYARSVVIINLEDGKLEVFNDGDNMSNDRISKLFKPYEKGTKGNFGLGLSIVKKVTEVYGYLVTGENMDDGVIFRITRNFKPKRTNEKKQA